MPGNGNAFGIGNGNGNGPPISPPGQAPVSQDDQLIADEETIVFASLFTDNGFGSDQDPNGDEFSVAEIDGEAFISGGSISVSTSGGRQTSFIAFSDGSLSFDPAADFQNLAVGETDTFSFTYRIRDEKGFYSAVPSLVTVTINGINDAPTLASGAVSAMEDGPALDIDLSLLGEDIDSDDNGTTLTYAIANEPSEGNVLISGSTLTFDPGDDFQDLSSGETREVVVRVSATDRHGATVESDIIVTVSGEDDTPVTPRFTNITAGANGDSFRPKISADGSTVVFYSTASNLVPGEIDANGNIGDVFIYDVASGDLANLTGIGDGQSAPEFSISADGSAVAFYSSATNLIPGEADLNGSTLDIFVYDSASGSLANLTNGGNGSSFSPTLSADGTQISFVSTATNLVPGQTDLNGSLADIFVYDLVNGTISNVTNGGNDDSSTPNISADGTTLAFHSDASNLVPGQVDNNGNIPDVFVLNLDNGDITNVTDGGNNASRFGIPTADGSLIAFHSFASNLVPGQIDPNGGAEDVFIFEPDSGAITNLTGDSNGNSQALPAGLSSDGLVIAFDSGSTDLVDGAVDTNGRTVDVFFYGMSSGEFQNLTDGGDGGSYNPSISSDASTLTFWSDATNLIPDLDDLNGMSDIFVYEFL